VDKIDELALFGRKTIRMTPELSLEVGARLFRSTLSVESTVRQRGGNAPAPVSDHLADSGFAPDLRLSYHPGPDLLLYLSAARGYRSGGFNTGEPAQAALSAIVQPFRRYAGDQIWTYELGAQAYLLDNRLAVKATVFDSDWHNLQTDTLLSRGFPYTGNVGDARVTGLEAAVAYTPVDDLSFTLGAIINEPNITRVDPAFPQATNGGLPGSPEYTVSTSARRDWRVPVFGEDARLFAETRASYFGSSTLGFGLGQMIGDYFDVDVKIGFALRAWQALLYVDNLSDGAGKTYSFGNPYQPSDPSVTRQRPRTVGVSLRRTF
jgi:outer membrane receptor protein involved in Fe transport